MEFDPFSLVIGINSPEDQDEIENARRKYAEMAVSIHEMTQTEGWKHLLDEVGKFEELHSLKPEFYSNNPNLAHIHTGALYALKHVKDWAENANSFIKQQEYEQAQKNNETEE